jgi:hypothetical protein
VRRGAAWQEHFFELMSRAKHWPFSKVLEELSTTTGRLEVSFASKLVASLDPTQPVVDSFVLKNVGLRLPLAGSADRVRKACEVYDTLCTYYSSFLATESGHALVAEFRSHYPEAMITDLKMVDLVLWQTRDDQTLQWTGPASSVVASTSAGRAHAVQGAMMKWNIEGADRDDGSEVTLVIEAADEADAVARANARGILVASATPASAPGVSKSPSHPVSNNARGGIQNATVNRSQYPGKAIDVLQFVDAIKRKFAQTGSPAQVPKLRRGSFTAELREDGVEVSNLGAQPFLPWAVFKEAVSAIIHGGGRAARGDAMGNTLGSPRLPFDSIEGRVAHRVYGKRQGDNVFRRVTPIACILIWAEICEAAPNELVLRARV